MGMPGKAADRLIHMAINCLKVCNFITSSAAFSLSMESFTLRSPSKPGTPADRFKIARCAIEPSGLTLGKPRSSVFGIRKPGFTASFKPGTNCLKTSKTSNLFIWA